LKQTDPGWIGKSYKDVCYQYNNLLLKTQDDHLTTAYNIQLLMFRDLFPSTVLDDQMLGESSFWQTRSIKNYFKNVSGGISFDSASPKTTMRNREGLWTKHREILHLAGIHKLNT